MSDLALEWKWKIEDTEVSDGISLGIVVESATGELFPHCDAVVSHTRFTAGWNVLFTPGGRSIGHQYVFTGGPCTGIPDERVRPIGVFLHFVNPIRQSLSVSKLTVEAWPGGRLPIDPLKRPHRAPPPEAPFQEIPVNLLGRATAGAVEDLDGDGLPELLVLERHGHAHLYRGDRNATFREELTEHAGLAGLATLGTGAMFLDLDGDHDKDLVITSEFEVPRLFENRGGLRFGERVFLADRHLSFWYGVAADDLDSDGNTDLLFFSPLEPFFLLLHNVGGWQFEAVEDFVPTANLTDQGRLTFTAAFADIDGDEWPDLFLGREELLRNRRGKLTSIRPAWPRPSSQKTEGAVWTDLNGDGDLDLLVLRDATESGSYPSKGSPLGKTRVFIGDGLGQFRENTETAALPALVSAEVALAEDFDNDGGIDLYLCQRDRSNYLLLNDGGGGFVDATERSGLGDSGGCDAAMAADFDGDGGVDIVILSYGLRPRVRLNRLERGRWLGVIPAGRRPGTEAIGARVRVLEPGSDRHLGVRWSRRGRGFGSVGPAELRFGVGSLDEVKVEVEFANGVTRVQPGVRTDATILVREPSPGIGGVLACVAEARFPLRRWTSRFLLVKSWILWAITGFGGVAGALLVMGRGARTLAWVVLALAGGAALTIGSFPGRGLRGSPPGQLAAGATVGALAVLAGQGARKLRRSLEREVTDSLEDLIRLTLDYRHGGVEVRGLLAIESRARNLFPHDRLHAAFYSELVGLTRGYAEGTGAQVRRLIHLAGVALPQGAESSKLGNVNARLEDLCSALPRLEGDERALREWSRKTASLAHDARFAVEELLRSVDFHIGSDVEKVIHEASDLMKEQLRLEGIRLSIEVNPSGDALALISGPDLLVVLENLFAGSMAAMQGAPEKWIAVSCRSEGRRVRIRFEDSGPGVPHELQEKIFELGFTTKPTGTGYGLARSREILAKFGGSLSLVDDGGATSFVIHLHRIRRSQPGR